MSLRGLHRDLANWIAAINRRRLTDVKTRYSEAWAAAVAQRDPNHQCDNYHRYFAEVLAPVSRKSQKIRTVRGIQSFVRCLFEIE